MQNVIFPMKTMRITQGYGLEVDGVASSTYSHTGSYALDLGGTDTSAEYLYAPCDVTVMRHYRGTGYNAVWYQSNNEVMCADGVTRKLIFLLLHANDNVIAELGITVGKVFKQGEPFYKEGTGGGVATHAHLEVGLVPFTGTGWFKSSYIDDRGNNVWIINNKLIPSNIFFLDSTHIIKDNYGYNWKYLAEDYEILSYTGIRILTSTNANVQYFNTPNADDVAGNNLPTGSEYKAIGRTTKPDKYGFTYVKFIINDKEYWMAYLTDRVELFSMTTNIFENGIDVSDVQGEIDWAAVKKAGISFNINKIVGTNANYQIYVSQYWENNYNACKQNGIKIGGYLYTYAFNEKEAEDELAVLLPAIRGKQFEYPIFVDVEDRLLYQNCTPTQITATTNYICQRLEEEGFYPGIYVSPNFLKNYMVESELGPYDIWIADWDGDVDWNGEYTMHQYTSDGNINGISGRVDMDHSFVDYETKIKATGLNGWKNSSEENTPSIREQKKFNIRLKLKYDTEANWNATDLILMRGEVAIATFPDGKALMKIGDGVNKFKDLKYLEADADIYDWAKQPEKPSYDISEIEQIDTLILYCGNSK